MAKGVLEVKKNSAKFKTEGLKFYKRIGFQNLAVNIVMLAMFIIAIFTMDSNIKNVIHIANSASIGEIELLSKEAELREGIITIDGNISALLGAVSMGTNDPANYEVYFTNIDAVRVKIDPLLQFMEESIFVSEAANGPEQMAEVRRSTEEFRAVVDEMIVALRAADAATSMDIYINKYIDAQAATYAAYDAAEVTIQELASQLEIYLNMLYKQAFTKTIVLVVMFVIIIIISVILSEDHKHRW